MLIRAKYGFQITQSLLISSKLLISGFKLNKNPSIKTFTTTKPLKTQQYPIKLLN